MGGRARLMRDTARSISAQFRKILFATDFSPASLRALPYVKFVARRYDSTVYLVHVIGPQPAIAIPAGIRRGERADSLRGAEEQLRALEGSEELRGISHKRLVGEGKVAKLLLKAVREHNIGLIIVGTHGRTGIKHLVLGSVAEEIFRSSSCPVLTVGAHVASPGPVSRILLPTDLSTTSRCGLPFAVSLAADAGAELVALHVLPQSIASNPEAGVLTEPLREEVQSVLAGALPAGVRSQAVLAYGDTAETIVSEAEKLKAQFIVLGIRSSFTSHRLSNVAYRVAISAGCPVLTVRDPAKNKG